MKSIEIWKNRPDNSGSGSRGSLAAFKASFINDFVKEKNISSIIDFGCGDLYNASLFNVKEYLGIDIVDHQIPEKVLAQSFKTLTTRFDQVELDKGSDLVICLDVLYHILKDELEYLKSTLEKIVELSSDYIVIYAQDSRDTKFSNLYSGHLYNSPWRQILEEKNVKLIYEQEKCKPGTTAKFFVYQKN